MDQGHGRHETRELFVFDLRPDDLIDFPHAAQAAVVIRTSHHLKKVKVTEEIQIAITSCCSQRLSPAQFQQAWRDHWKIENQSHYVRDVTFNEDRSLARTGHSSQNLGALRNLVRGIASIQCAGKSKTYLPDFRQSVQFDADLLFQLLTRSPIQKAA